MAAPNQKKIDDFYREQYGVDFSKLTAEQRALADSYLERVKRAGKEDVQELLQAGISSQTARQLALYQSYKAGQIFDPIDRAGVKKAAGSKLTDAQIDREVEKQRQQFVDAQAQQFRPFVRDTYPWENWTRAVKAQADEAIKIMDGVKLYRGAGGIGIGAEYAKDSEALAAQGGMSQNDATALARYKMYKEVTGGDPDWQGPLNINQGEREPEPTLEEIRANQAAFFKGKTEREAAWARERLAAERSKERFYDDLVQPAQVARK